MCKCYRENQSFEAMVHGKKGKEESELKEGLRGKRGYFVRECKRCGLNVNSDKNKMMVLLGKKVGLVCKLQVCKGQLEHSIS